MQHYLITLLNLHSYVMTQDKRDIERVAAKMFDVFEKRGGKTLAPIVFVTPLTTDLICIELVRDIVEAVDNQAKQLMKTATDFHVSMFALDPESQEHARLMALH